MEGMLNKLVAKIQVPSHFLCNQAVRFASRVSLEFFLLTATVKSWQFQLCVKKETYFTEEGQHTGASASVCVGN